MLTTQSRLGQHTFQGPFTSNSQLAALSGVYIITTLNYNNQHVILDVGESEDIRHRITNHDRTEQWQRNKINNLYAWVLHCDEQARMLIERAHRLAYLPICGDK